MFFSALAVQKYIAFKNDLYLHACLKENTFSKKKLYKINDCPLLIWMWIPFCCVKRRTGWPLKSISFQLPVNYAFKIVFFCTRLAIVCIFIYSFFGAPLATNKFTCWSRSAALLLAVVERLLELCRSVRDLPLNLFQRPHTLSQSENDLSAWGGSDICHWLKQVLFFTPLSNVT